MTLWNPQHVLDDLYEFKLYLSDVFKRTPDSAWANRTGDREKDWTVKETLAHIVSISQFFQKGVQSALTDTPLDIPNVAKREDLRAFNNSEIARLSHHTPNELVSQLLGSLTDVEATVKDLSPDDYEKTVDLKVYNRPTKVMDMIDFQLSHAGIIHGAQIIRTGAPRVIPLWYGAPLPMVWRQIDRYLRQFSYAYWNDLAGDLDGVINIHILDEHGQAEWSLHVNPQGGSAHIGLSKDDALFDAYFSGVHEIFNIFTGVMSIDWALDANYMWFEGDYPEPMTLFSYFSPAPPRRKLPDFK
jgi:hypothetical protein